MDGEASAIGVELQGFDGAKMLDDAGKHDASLRLRRKRRLAPANVDQSG
jgi:hypothetical protein